MSGITLHDYPVDPVGYGRGRPDPAWPAGSGLAVQLSILAADPAPPVGDERRGRVGTAVDAPEYRLSRDRAAGMRTRRDRAFGSRVGLHRVRLMLRNAGLPATWFFAPSLADRLPELVAALASEGDELALLGDAADLRGGPAAVADCRRRLAALTGKDPVGWRSRARHPDGRKILARNGGFLYDADAADDDLPYWVHGAGQGILALPAAPLAGRGAEAYRLALARARAESATRPQLLRLELHPDKLGRPDAAEGLAALLADLADSTDLWLTTAEAVACHWRARFPFAWI